MEEMIERLGSSELPTWLDLVRWSAERKIGELLRVQSSCAVWDAKGMSEHSRIKGQIEAFETMLKGDFGIAEAMQRLGKAKAGK